MSYDFVPLAWFMSLAIIFKLAATWKRSVAMSCWRIASEETRCNEAHKASKLLASSQATSAGLSNAALSAAAGDRAQHGKQRPCMFLAHPLSFSQSYSTQLTTQHLLPDLHSCSHVGRLGGCCPVGLIWRWIEFLKECPVVQKMRSGCLTDIHPMTSSVKQSNFHGFHHI